MEYLDFQENLKIWKLDILLVACLAIAQYDLLVIKKPLFYKIP